jgi:hypothetical protein
MEEKQGKGQPRKFNTAEEFESVFIEYISKCREREELPNVAGFCVFARMNRDTFYAQKEYYSDTFELINNMLEDRAINCKCISDTFKTFYMKNKCGYKDRQEIDADVKTTEIRVDLDD